jgi:hypothetical protein
VEQSQRVVVAAGGRLLFLNLIDEHVHSQPPST